MTRRIVVLGFVAVFALESIAPVRADTSPLGGFKFKNVKISISGGSDGTFITAQEAVENRLFILGAKKAEDAKASVSGVGIFYLKEGKINSFRLNLWAPKSFWDRRGYHCTQVSFWSDIDQKVDEPHTDLIIADAVRKCVAELTNALTDKSGKE